MKKTKYLLVAALLLAGAIGIDGGSAMAQGMFPGLPPATTITGVERIPADTQLGAGLNPQTEYITVDQLGAYNGVVVPLTDGATVTIDASAGNVFTLSMGAVGIRTISTPSNLKAGKVFDLVLTHTTASSTASWPGIYKFSCPGAVTAGSSSNCGGSTGAGGAPTLSTTAASVDVIRFVCDSTTRCLGTPRFNFQ